ncbi:SH3 domain-containing protein [Verrucomicrobia bacterium]|nr:SH3 domain-containing protein [Verrucomicrobiota bacterium]
MKPLGRFPIPALTLLIAVSGLYAKNVVSEVTPTEAGIVSGERVNIRARASLIGERVAQLRKGDKVTVLAKVTVAPPHKGEPTDWLKIAMPAAGQTWVHLSFVKEGKVTAKKLNVRAGGSERFSIVGRLAKGDAVKEKRTAGDWIEIEHPAGAHAYVAAKFIELGQAAEETKSEETPEAKPAEVTQTEEPKETPEAKPAAEEVTEAEESEGKPEAVAEAKGEPEESNETNEPGNMPEPPAPEVVVVDAPESGDAQKPPMGNPEDAEEAKPEPASAVTDTKLPVPPPRIVTREGTIKRRFFRSPKAPSRFELLDDNGRTINYLYSSDSGPLKSAKGEDGEPITFTNLMGMLRNRRVILTGIEAVDPRWPSLPLLDVRTLKTLP